MLRSISIELFLSREIFTKQLFFVELRMSGLTCSLRIIEFLNGLGVSSFDSYYTYMPTFRTQM